MRRRLALLVAAAMTLVLVGFLAPLAILIRVVAADRAVTSVTVEAQALTPVVATTDRDSLELVVDELNANAEHPVTVFLPDGTAVGAPAPRTQAVDLAARGRSITVAVADGREILIAIQGLPDGTAVVRAFVSDAELTRGVPRAWLVLGLIGVALLLLGVAFADALARSVVRPISQLAKVSHRLASGELDARAEPTGPPEVQEVADGLNHLAGRIRDLVLQEREAVADLSHRLRTPLTALRLEAETLCPDGVTRMAVHVEAMERAVTTLIEDSRRRGAGPGRCDAAAVVADRAAFWAVLAEDQDRSMKVTVDPGPLLVRAAADDLAACVDALLANVFAHTPEGSPFAVRLMPRAGGGAYVVVEDAGPGFGTADPLQRGASGGGSTGLGLDIARQTTQASGGSLTLGAGLAGRGAGVVLELGPPEGPPPRGRRHSRLS